MTVKTHNYAKLIYFLLRYIYYVLTFDCSICAIYLRKTDVYCFPAVTSNILVTLHLVHFQILDSGEQLGLKHFKPIKPLGSGDTGRFVDFAS